MDTARAIEIVLGLSYSNIAYSEEAKVACEVVENLPREIDYLRGALKALLDWGRENISPGDMNSPHDLLIDAAYVLSRKEEVA